MLEENLGEFAGKWKFGSSSKEVASFPKVKRYHLRASLSYPRKYLTAQWRIQELRSVPAGPLIEFVVRILTKCLEFLGKNFNTGQGPYNFCGRLFNP